MKKTLAIILALALSLGLVACASTSTPTPTTTAASAAATTAVSADTTTSDKPIVVGYVVNDMGHEWYQNIVKGAKVRASEVGIELKVVDAAMDAAKQVTQIENLLAEGIDVLCITPVDVKALANVVAEAKSMGIPVITESNVVENTLCYVGIDNLSGGKNAGLWFAQYAKDNKIDPKILIVGLPAFEDCRLRVEGFKAGLDEAGLKYEIVQEVDGQGSKETSLKVSQDAITAHPEINVIFGINDNSTTGGMAAYSEAGLDESTLTAIGFGFEGNVGREALLSGGPYKAACAMFPDYMGVSLMDAAVMAAKGEELPANYKSGTIIMTAKLFPDFYADNGDGTYTTNFDAIRALLNA